MLKTVKKIDIWEGDGCIVQSVEKKSDGMKSIVRCVGFKCVVEISKDNSISKVYDRFR